MSEFSKLLFGRCVIGASCFFGCFKRSKVMQLTTNANMGIPHSLPFMEGRALVNVSPAGLFSIRAILSLRAWAQVFPAIVQRIVVFVVNSLNPKKHLMQENIFTSLGIKRTSAFHQRREPIPLRQPLKISSVNDGILSLCQRDKAVGFVKRLGNGMPLLRLISGHKSSLKGLLLLSRHFTTVCTLLLFAILLTAGRAEAGPLDLLRHPIRTIQRHPVATAFAFAGVAATVDFFGLRHCREGSVENCRAKYGAAYGSFGAATGANFAVIAATSGCWKDQNKAFCSIFSYGGSAVQLGFGLNQFQKKGGEHEKVDFLLPHSH